MARDDCGLSSKVINLRKEVEKSRKAVRQLVQDKETSNSMVQTMLAELENCEEYERRRHEVALETEKSLADQKTANLGMKKEVHLAEARRRDAELVCYGLQ